MRTCRLSGGEERRRGGGARLAGGVFRAHDGQGWKGYCGTVRRCSGVGQQRSGLLLSTRQPCSQPHSVRCLHCDQRPSRTFSQPASPPCVQEPGRL